MMTTPDTQRQNPIAGTSDATSRLMHAFAVDAYGSPGTYRELPIPTVDPNQLLIRVHTAGVNLFDLTVLAGGLQDRVPASFPLIAGFDVAGTIEQLGTAVTGWAVGDAVFGRVVMPALGGGTFAEYVAALASSPLAPKPRSISFEQAAALPIPAMAALVSVTAVELHPGDTVLVVGATGSVGGYAVQLAAQQGAHVIATADPTGQDAVKDLGAAEVIAYRDRDVAAAVQAAHPDGIDALIDAASDAAGLTRLTEVVRSGGRVVATRYSADVDALAQRGIRATNINLAAVQTAAMLNEIARLVDAGDLTVMPVTIFPLQQAGEALQALSSGHPHRKIVLSVR
jgi:NADPH:quinone reductase